MGHDAEVSESSAPLLGRQIDHLVFQSIDGDTNDLEVRADQRVIVLAWTGLDCPMSRVYLPRLRRLAADFEGDGVQFFLVNSNSQDSLRAIHEHARQQELGFPTVRDRGAALAHQLGVKRTTEVLRKPSPATVT